MINARNAFPQTPRRERASDASLSRARSPLSRLLRAQPPPRRHHHIPVAPSSHLLLDAYMNAGLAESLFRCESASLLVIPAASGGECRGQKTRGKGCFACTCVVYVVRTTRRRAFLFRSYSSSSARVSPLSSRRGRARARRWTSWVRASGVSRWLASAPTGRGGVGEEDLPTKGGPGKRWFGSPSRAPFAVSDQSITYRGSRKRSTWLYPDPSASRRPIARSRTGFVRLQASRNCRIWD